MSICIVISFQVKTMMTLEVFFFFLIQRFNYWTNRNLCSRFFFSIVLKGEEIITDFILKTFFSELKHIILCYFREPIFRLHGKLYELSSVSFSVAFSFSFPRPQFVFNRLTQLALATNFFKLKLSRSWHLIVGIQILLRGFIPSLLITCCDWKVWTSKL